MSVGPMTSAFLARAVSHTMQDASVAIVPWGIVQRPSMHADSDEGLPPLEADIAFSERNPVAVTANPQTLRDAASRRARPLAPIDLRYAAASPLFDEAERILSLGRARVSSLLMQLHIDPNALPTATDLDLPLHGWRTELGIGSAGSRAAARKGTMQLVQHMARSLHANRRIDADSRRWLQGLLARGTRKPMPSSSTFSELETGAYLFLVGTLAVDLKKLVIAQALITIAADIFEHAAHYDTAAIVSEHAPRPADTSWRWLAAVEMAPGAHATNDTIRIHQGLVHGMAFGNWTDAEHLLHKLARIARHSGHFKRTADHLLRAALMRTFALKQNGVATPTPNDIASLQYYLENARELWTQADQEAAKSSRRLRRRAAPLRRITPRPASIDIATLCRAIAAARS
jgi:hypothetical protein